MCKLKARRVQCTTHCMHVHHVTHISKANTPFILHQLCVPLLTVAITRLLDEQAGRSSPSQLYRKVVILFKPDHCAEVQILNLFLALVFHYVSKISTTWAFHLVVKRQQTDAHFIKDEQRREGDGGFCFKLTRASPAQG